MNLLLDLDGAIGVLFLAVSSCFFFGSSFEVVRVQGLIGAFAYKCRNP